MMKQRRLILLFAVFLLLMATTNVVFAQSGEGTVVEADETIRNDIVLLDEDLTIQEGAVVKGDIALFGGNATIAGEVDGDIVLFGGNLTAMETAVIDGDCALLGGSLTDETAEGINCTDVTFGEDFAPAISAIADNFNLQEPPEPPAPPVPPDWPQRSAFSRFVSGVAEAAGQTLVMALLALGVAYLLPTHLKRAEESVRRQPILSGTVGFLTALSVPVILVLLGITSAILTLVCIGILGFPIIFVLAVAFVAAMVFGWIAMGDLVGTWLAERMNLQNRSLPVTAALGTGAITLLIGLIGALPFMIGEGLLTIVIGSIGLGAATLTRLGTRPYPPYAEPVDEKPITEDPEKISSILETLPVEDVEDLKDNN